MSLPLEPDKKSDESLMEERSDSPEPSCVSMKRFNCNEHRISNMSLPLEPDKKSDESLMEERSDSPEPSCVSMKSNWSMDRPYKFKVHATDLSLIQGKRSDSPEPSCVSLKSDWSMDRPYKFKDQDRSTDPRIQKKKSKSKISSRTEQDHQMSTTPQPMMNMHLIDLNKTLQTELELVSVCHQILKSNLREKFKRINEGISQPGSSTLLNEIYTELYITEGWSGDINNEHEVRQIETASRRPATQETPIKCNDLFKDKSIRTVLTKGVAGIGKTVSVQKIQKKKSKISSRTEQDHQMSTTPQPMMNMKLIDPNKTLQTELDLVSVCPQKLKSNLREKFKRVNEGISQHGSSALLNEIYTELYITEGWSGDVNNEHEIETASRRPATQETPIKCNDLFKDKSIRTVLTKGVAGIGKTVSVQKFILDWAEGKANQDITFMFPLPFRELNLMKQQNLSLMNLLHHFFPEMRKLDLINCDSYKVMFIFDGLDECRLPLNFQDNERLCDVTESASVDVLLTNLIKGNLLPSALLWITSRPGAANQIPPECVDQVTEIRGFNDPQKEEYFRKRISDQSLANKIITHVKSSRSLYIMCHIPVFCWISATVLERMLGEAESGEIPKTLTQMFTHFLIFQIKHKDQKYHQKYYSDPQQTRESILALGKLAFQQLEKGNLIFYEEDLRECGISLREASVYSGVCTQIFREEFVLHLGKVFSFVHLSVQEFLAALYAFLFFISRNVTEQTTDLSGLFSKSNMSDFLKSAVDKALQSENGHLDLFLRFLLGLSLESNQTLLRGLMPQTGSSSHSKQETVKYIKEKIRENPSPEKSINLFHCLNELNDHSLVQEIQTYLNNEGCLRLHGRSLSPAQWSALAFLILSSEEKLDTFSLFGYYYQSEECLLRLLPVVQSSRIFS
ncbi:hypothetical protein PGIGA_G00103340 [Pangasianodon gigas]|uniref:Uncharacterized protein n=1 Tax=Pangasianodon gigas TaxID=30993 RepID=A0ACC5XG86_PANGG|nr:hypothetical protein [Pangasianodon gigas]